MLDHFRGADPTLAYVGSRLIVTVELHPIKAGGFVQ
jgi:hypothetical protein